MLISATSAADQDRCCAVVLDDHREAGAVVRPGRACRQFELDRCRADRLLMGEEDWRTS